MLAMIAAAAMGAPECRGVPIRRMIASYAQLQRQQNVDQIARLFGTDGEVDNPGAAPVRGADAVRAFLRGFHGFTVSSNQLTVEKVVQVGHSWRVLGRFHQTGSTPDSKSYDVNGSFNSTWACTPVGWQVQRMATGK